MSALWVGARSWPGARAERRGAEAETRLPLIYSRLLEHFGPQHWWPARTPFEVVAGAILTQQTSWKNVERAIDNLRQARLLTPARLRGVSPTRLAHLIRPSGYFNQKTKRLKAFLDFLFDRYQSSLKRWFREPTNRIRQELLSIYGIGPETADSILLYAAQKPVFVVDAYTTRIFRRLGLIQTDRYNEVQKYFEAHLPRRVHLYNEFHALIVALGKNICKSKPLCARCPLDDLCPKVGVI